VINLQGKTVLVTGGAVGTQMAKAFLGEGSNVAIVYRNSSRIETIRREIPVQPASFVAVQADLSHPDEATRVTAEVKGKFGGMDFLINALGGWMGGKNLHEHSLAEMNGMFSIDLVPTFNIMSCVLPIMKERRFGRIVNFISMQVFGSGKGNSVYAASKSAIFALSKAAADEYKEYGISVYTVAPSTIDTESNRRGMPAADTTKWVGIQDIVDSVKFLCSSGESMNGTTLKFPGRI